MKEPVKCPYCNNAVKIYATETSVVRKAWVECPSCEMRGPIEAWPIGMTDEEAAVDAWNELFERDESLQAENAKLRELVRFMWFADYAGHFSTLPEHQEHQAAVWQRMCELGVEVDA